MDAVRESAVANRKLREVQSDLGSFHVCDPSEFQSCKSGCIRDVSGIRQWKELREPGGMPATPMLFADSGDLAIDPWKQQIQQAGLTHPGVSGKSRDLAGQLLSKFVNPLSGFRADRQYRERTALINAAQRIRMLQIYLIDAEQIAFSAATLIRSIR